MFTTTHDSRSLRCDLVKKVFAIRNGLQDAEVLMWVWMFIMYDPQLTSTPALAPRADNPALALRADNPALAPRADNSGHSRTDEGERVDVVEGRRQGSSRGEREGARWGSSTWERG
jgi:hypothetical protein